MPNVDDEEGGEEEEDGDESRERASCSFGVCRALEREGGREQERASRQASGQEMSIEAA